LGQKRDSSYSINLFNADLVDMSKSHFYSSDAEQVQYYAIVFMYDQYYSILGYHKAIVPNKAWGNPITDSLKIAVQSDKQLFKGVDVQILGVGKTPFGSDMTNLKLSLSINDVLEFIKGRNYFYIATFNSENPLQIVQNGVPNYILDHGNRVHSDTFNSDYIQKFGGDGSYNYVGVVLYDDKRNVLAYYEANLTK